MSILFISHKHPPMRAGMENQSFQLINGFTKNDNEVYSIIYKDGENKLLFFLKLKSRVK